MLAGVFEHRDNEMLKMVHGGKRLRSDNVKG